MAGQELTHVAIIPDGNRRWAKEKGLKPWEGHSKAGTYENLNALFKEAEKQGVKYLSFWGFSTENWKREKKEVDIIMRLILKGLTEFGEKVDEEKICFRHVGRKDRLLKRLVKKINELEERTKDNGGLCVLLCLDYGGRDEILRAVKKLLEEGTRPTRDYARDDKQQFASRNRSPTLSEEEFLNYLDTTGLPDPDLIIRTGGEKRFSGFMPFQSTYAELFFSDVMFPDFNPENLREAIEEFRKRKRRFGS